MFKKAAVLVLLALAPRIAAAQPAMLQGQFLRDAGEPSTLERESQSKIAFVGGSWWAVLGGTSGLDFYQLDPASKTWALRPFPGSHVSSDPSARADVKWDGTNLIVCYNQGSGRGTLLVSAYSFTGSSFAVLPGFPAVVDTNAVIKEWTVAEDSLGRLWVAFANVSTYAVRGSSGTGPSGWTSFLAAVFMGNASTGVDGDLGACGIVAFSGKIGMIWTEAFAPPNNHTKFRWRPDSGPLDASAWSAVELAQEDATLTRLTDDHVSIRAFEGQLFCASKTNYDPPDVGFPRFTLMHRDAAGNWTHFTVTAIDSTRSDGSTRPVCAIDASRRLVYVFWHKSGIQFRTTPVDSPGSFSDVGEAILPASDNTWDCSSSSAPMDATTGVLVLADQNTNGSTFWNFVTSPSGGGGLASIVVSPSTATVTTGSAFQFSAQGRDAAGTPVAVSPAWTASGGTISQTGLYTAPATAGTFTVTATSGSVSGSATVTVVSGGTPPGLATLAISPLTATIAPGATLAFTATARDQFGNPIAVQPAWTATGGTITQSGVFTAGMSMGTFDVTASSGDKRASATVTIATPPPLPPAPPGTMGVASIQVSPSQASTAPGGAISFTAQARDAQGNLIEAPILWQTDGGTIDQAGHFVAGTAPGTFQVTASSGAAKGVASVTVQSSSGLVSTPSGGHHGGGCRVGGDGQPLQLAPLLVFLAVALARRRFT